MTTKRKEIFMKTYAKIISLILGSISSLAAYSQQCPDRLAPGSAIPDPPMVFAKNGVIGGVFYSYFDGDPTVGRDGRYCLMYSSDGIAAPVEAPVLRLAPGERIGFSLQNRMPVTQPADVHPWNPDLHPQGSGTAPCSPEAVMQSFATNLHFHGTNVPPVCTSDETITTLVQPNEAAWQYNFTIPLNASPGLDWYHPHIHGMTQEQMLGGMTGGLVIDAPNEMPNVIAGLRERILVLRDQDLDPSPPGIRYVERPEVIRNLTLPLIQRTIYAANGLPASDALLRKLLSGAPAITSEPLAPGTAALPSVIPPWKDVSVNKVQVKFTPTATGAPSYTAPGIIRMEGASEFWRVANVSADTYMNIQVRFKVNGVNTPQVLRVVGMDGIPISAPNGQLLFDDNSMAPPGAVSTKPNKTIRVKQVLLPPGGRVEFIVPAPAVGQVAELVTLKYETQADYNPLRTLAIIEAPAPGAVYSAPMMPAPTASIPRTRFMDFTSNNPKPLPDHALYFSQNNINGEFYITEDASTTVGAIAPPEVAYTMKAGPSIYVPTGATQEWKIENRALEAHAFHMHQIRFRVLKRYPSPVGSADVLDEFSLRDTVDLPAYSGVGAYPSVTIRVYFNEPDIRGNFMFHCHIIEHEDNGMMGIVRVVDPSEMPLAANARRPAGIFASLKQDIARLGRDNKLASWLSSAASQAFPSVWPQPKAVNTVALLNSNRPVMRDSQGKIITPQVCLTPTKQRRWAKTKTFASVQRASQKS
jgi:FtsP/CotA-like multicopper oxidase with cupredoxin domain